MANHFERCMDAVFTNPLGRPPVTDDSKLRCSRCRWAHADCVYIRCGHMRTFHVLSPWFTTTDVCAICAAQDDVRQFVEKKADQPFRCPICDEVVMERIDIRVDGLNKHEGYRERLCIVNAILSKVLSDACMNCYMPSPVSYPLILNAADVDAYLSKSEDELKMIVMRTLYAVLEETK